MDSDTIYQKSTKGQQEIATRAFKLPPKPRALLMLIDGRRSVAQLLGNSRAMDAEAFLVQLEAQGFIEAVAKQAGAGAVETPLTRARTIACELLHEALGPDADDLAVRLEQCQTAEELLVYVDKYRNFIASAQTAAQGEAFVAKVRAALSPPAAAVTPPGGARAA